MVDFEAFLGPARVSPPGRHAKTLVPVMIFNPKPKFWQQGYDDYDVLLEVLGPCANAMLGVLLPKLWFGWKIMTGHNCFWMSSWGSLTLAGPKKASKSTILHNRLNKKKLLVGVANLATCCHDDYDVLLKVLGTLRKCYVSSPVAKTLEIMTGTTVFGCLPGAHPCWTKKSFKTNNFT